MVITNNKLNGNTYYTTYQKEKFCFLKSRVVTDTRCKIYYRLLYYSLQCVYAIYAIRVHDVLIRDGQVNLI